MSDLIDRLKKISAELDSHSDPFGDIGPAMDAAIDEIEQQELRIAEIEAENERLRGACISVTYVEEYPLFRQGYPTHEMEELLNADVCTLIVRMIAILRVKLQESEGDN